ncbi:Cellobiose phosphorylase [Planctomycetales bacterium 10988]|nr:Cellobiose phosphorylase [Planctomycetales bacterium 10988]
MHSDNSGSWFGKFFSGQKNGQATVPRAEERPLRTECYSLEQLERHGGSLATWHRIAAKSRRNRLLANLAQHESQLQTTYQTMRGVVAQGVTISPAGRWLLENAYLIEHQIQMTRQHLPRGYSQELPQLADSPDAIPRVYDLALELVRRTDGQIDAENIQHFISAYQRVAVLKLGELWAIPIMLRLALFENIHLVASRVARQLEQRQLAEVWSEKIRQAAREEPRKLILVLADLIRSDPPLSPTFVSELSQQLQAPSTSMAREWLESQLREQGQNLEQLVTLDSQHQAIDQVSVGNSITSLRKLDSIDWAEFVETQSRVHQRLQEDPISTYGQMSFASRDRYRHVIEKIAKRSPRSEPQVAAVAVELAQEAADHPRAEGEDFFRGEPIERASHVGYYLVDQGRYLLERSVGYRPTLGDRWTNSIQQAPLVWYWGSLATFTLLAGALIGWIAWESGIAANWSWWFITLLAVFLFLPLVQTSISCVHWLTTLVVPPNPIDRFDFSKGIPDRCRSLVVVPTMISSTRAVDSLLEALEIRFLANRDGNLFFALLTDFPDAASPEMPTDAELLQRMRDGIDRLNKQYQQDRRGLFFWFHRPRKFNEQENAWMGWERKRGKLSDLNALIQGGDRSAFSEIVGDTSLLSSVRYVITLDTDTQLPRDAASQMVGCLAHPLNRPYYDRKKGRVTKGYAILQPRNSATVTSANRTWFSRIFAGDAGIDPYTRQISDVYQDLFGEGSFVGKGIYDVHAFEIALRGRMPENRILSHDLIESSYARSGLLNDLELFEGFPGTFLADMSRRHRWIRGDWQIAQWVLPRTPIEGGTAPNVISWVSWWKVLDNLRRSVTPLSFLFFFLFTWLTCGPWGAALGTAVTLVLYFLPNLLGAAWSVVHKPEEMPWVMYLRNWLGQQQRSLGQVGLNLAFLPYETHCTIDAVARAWYRMLISKKKLLEWTTADDAERRSRGDLRGHYEVMAANLIVSFGMGMLLAIFQPHSLWAASPILLLWALGPAFAWVISLPIRRQDERLQVSQRVFLRKIARRTWHFFDTFINERENWLPPDNFQEHPVEILASRTSPTNLGLGLLSTLAAYDFGYLPLGRMSERIKNSLESMDNLERYRGHFYNWYDTRTCQPIEPRYVSTVDSGNLAGHLLVLRMGLLELRELPQKPQQMSQGLQDTLGVLVDLAKQSQTENAKPEARISNEVLNALEHLVREGETPSETITRLNRFLVQAATVASDAAHHVPPGAERFREWAVALESQCQAFLTEFAEMAPWTKEAMPPLSVWEAGTGPQRERLGGLWERIQTLDHGVSLRNLQEETASISQELRTFLQEEVQTSEGSTDFSALRWVADALEATAAASKKQILELERLAEISEEMAVMDFRFLYDEEQDLLAIGFHTNDHRMDNSFYDLLASEARLASFIGIAQGQLPKDHWFALGRMLTRQEGEPMLLSWSGSMFEFLMPPLVMPSEERTLLEETCRLAVRRQMQYAREHNMPWGISESCYHVTDANLVYQYRAFGVPGLGFKQGLGDDLVIAPYATMMALIVEPHASTRNLETLTDLGYLGDYGFYESVDYTPGRLAAGNKPNICRTWMAHHSGMGLLGVAHVLLDRPMQRRFRSDPILQSHELLLQERIPGAVRPVNPETLQAQRKPTDPSQGAEPTLRVFDSPRTPTPQVHLLSNGTYQVMLTVAGGGYSRWNDTQVTRWQEDATCDGFGQFCYLRDVESGKVWSNTYQPTCTEPDRYQAVFSQGRVEFRRRDDDIETETVISVSSEDDVELRRVKLSNHGKNTRKIELTSYAEVVLAPAAADAAHRAFSNLFVQSELFPEESAILCRRRPRHQHEKPLFLIHLMAVRGHSNAESSYETSREVFVGRGHDPRNPKAMKQSGAMTNSEGSVLDPVVAIRREMEIPAEDSVTVDILTGVAETREQALSLIERYQDHRLAHRMMELSWTQSQLVLQKLQATEGDAQLFARIAGAVLYANPACRAKSSLLLQNHRSQSGLWRYGISGDLPIVLVRVSESDSLPLIRRLLQAHAYWRSKGLTVDLVIWNDDYSGYRQHLQDAIMGMISSGPEPKQLEQRGGIHPLRGDQITEEDRVLLLSTARVFFSDRQGTLTDQLNRLAAATDAAPTTVTPSRPKRITQAPSVEPPRRELLFANGIGGFTPDAKEYVITLPQGATTSAPWSNVIANDQLGSVVTESGLGYTWFGNAHEYRISPWYNDPVSDPTGEILYLRDEESGEYYSPTPAPARGPNPYVCRHGFGYTVWETEQIGLKSELTTFVAKDSPVKCCVLQVRNASGRPRRVSLTAFVEWVLGEGRDRTHLHVATELDPASGAILARNPYHLELGERVSFAQFAEVSHSWTCDRTEFLGRNGSHQEPAGMAQGKLSGKAGAGLDPCAAMRSVIDLNDGEQREWIFVLGAAEDQATAQALATRFHDPAATRQELEKVWQFWEQTLHNIHVETPDQSVNVMANGWLFYQTLASRYWGRSGYYQSGGAYGFRDQLQDSMALVHATPQLTREHLIRSAGRQFSEGDVQHWWHPPAGKGVRTRISDDYLWLPLATEYYIRHTGDWGVLAEEAPFLNDRPVAEGEESYYGQPQQAEEVGTLYEHCKRALKHGYRLGEHGLPLIGCGDWNDGMNSVGEQGKGESVWLAFFFAYALENFIPIAERHEDQEFAKDCRKWVEGLQKSIEKNAWDGKWYRRAYFDDGEPLGSASNPECQIDALPQAWSVITGLGKPERAQKALEAVDDRLVRHDLQLIQLFDPPFDESRLEPGYIKGYVPGVRENGGQYTHAAIWTAMAFAMQGDHKRAWQCFRYLNPVNHASNAALASVYKVEPYVVAADIYSVTPHEGRGGWTWYTGSAGWLYRLIIETLLGLQMEEGKRLRFKPCVPDTWNGYRIDYRFGGSWYHLSFVIPQGAGLRVHRVTLDSRELPDQTVPLVDDGQDHEVEITLGSDPLLLTHSNGQKETTPKEPDSQLTFQRTQNPGSKE